MNETDARARLEESHDVWGTKYPAIRGLWENAWAEFIPFLDDSPEIRRVIYSTNAIEPLDARMRRATRARGHLPNEQAALKCLYLTVRSLDPTGKGAARWMNQLEARPQRRRRHLRRPTLHHRCSSRRGGTPRPTCASHLSCMQRALISLLIVAVVGAALVGPRACGFDESANAELSDVRYECGPDDGAVIAFEVAAEAPRSGRAELDVLGEIYGSIGVDVGPTPRRYLMDISLSQEAFDAGEGLVRIISSGGSVVASEPVVLRLPPGLGCG